MQWWCGDDVHPTTAECRTSSNLILEVSFWNSKGQLLRWVICNCSFYFHKVFAYLQPEPFYSLIYCSAIPRIRCIFLTEHMDTVCFMSALYALRFLFGSWGITLSEKEKSPHVSGLNLSCSLTLVSRKRVVKYVDVFSAIIEKKVFVHITSTQRTLMVWVYVRKTWTNVKNQV